MTFAQQFNEAKQESGLSIRTIADKLNLSRGTIDSWSRGLRVPSVERQAEILNLLLAGTKDTVQPSADDAKKQSVEDTGRSDVLLAVENLTSEPLPSQTSSLDFLRKLKTVKTITAIGRKAIEVTSDHDDALDKLYALLTRYLPITQDEDTPHPQAKAMTRDAYIRLLVNASGLLKRDGILDPDITVEQATSLVTVTLRGDDIDRGGYLSESVHKAEYGEEDGERYKQWKFYSPSIEEFIEVLGIKV